MARILFVIDFQNDFVTGTLGTKEAQQLIPNISNKVSTYKAAHDKIYFTRDTHYQETYADSQEGRNLPVLHCIKGTWGWEIAEGINTDGCDMIEKETFGIKNISDYIDASVDAVEFVGVCTDICVVSNALILKAQRPELKISVDASCCAGTTVQRHLAALDVLTSNQVEIL